jgi:hypothetical protein
MCRFESGRLYRGIAEKDFHEYFEYTIKKTFHQRKFFGFLFTIGWQHVDVVFCPIHILKKQFQENLQFIENQNLEKVYCNEETFTVFSYN